MTNKNSTKVLLSFHRNDELLVKQLATALKRANIKVWLDPWQDGGDLPTHPTLTTSQQGMTFLLPILTPVAQAKCWVDDIWQQTIYNTAIAQKIQVLPVLSQLDATNIPHFLNHLSCANLGDINDKQNDPRYQRELWRLIKTIRDQSQNATILLPEVDQKQQAIAQTLTKTTITLEIHQSLLPLFENNGQPNQALLDSFMMMQDGLFYQLGVRFPLIDYRVSSDLQLNSLRILINDIPETEVELPPHQIMVSSTASQLQTQGIDGREIINPVTLHTCAWIDQHYSQIAQKQGLMIWSDVDYLILNLSAVLRRKSSSFITTEQTRAMLLQLEPTFPRLISEVMPPRVSLFTLTDILRRLVAEGISIRNLPKVLTEIIRWITIEKSPLFLTEYIRAALKREITHQFGRGQNQILVILLHPELEAHIEQASHHTHSGCYIDLPTPQISAIQTKLKQVLQTLPTNSQPPVILTDIAIRPVLRRLIASTLPMLHVLSYQDINPDTEIRPITRIER